MYVLIVDMLPTNYSVDAYVITGFSNRRKMILSDWSVTIFRQHHVI